MSKEKKVGKIKQYGVSNNIRNFILIFILVLTIDQISKYVAIYYLKDSINLFFFDLNLVYNTGAAFGLLNGKSFILGLVNVVVTFVIFIINFKMRLPLKEYFPLALVAGGAFGNGIDRLILGYVIDFIDLGWWPVFNIADMAIVAGVIWFGISLYIYD